MNFYLFIGLFCGAVLGFFALVMFFCGKDDGTKLLGFFLFALTFIAVIGTAIGVEKMTQERMQPSLENARQQGYRQAFSDMERVKRAARFAELLEQTPEENTENKE